MRLLIRVLIVFAIVMAALSALRGLFAPSGPQSGSDDSSARGGNSGGKTGKLLKDPICGTYVTAAGSLSATRESEVFYFCSEQCRDQFLATGT